MYIFSGLNADMSFNLKADSSKNLTCQYFSIKNLRRKGGDAGCGVWGARCRVRGVEGRERSGVQGARCSVQGAEYGCMVRMQGAGCGVRRAGRGAGCNALGVVCRVLSTGVGCGCRVRGAVCGERKGCWVQNECCTQMTLETENF